MAVEEIDITVETLQGQSAYCPDAVFMMGARLAYVDEALRTIDREKNLCLGSILGSTPPVWVHKDGFFINRWMVTNGEYLRFMLFAEEDEDGNLLRTYDDPELWDHVWSGMNYRLTDVKMTFKIDDATEIMIENYQGASSFVEAYILSIRYEIERVIGRDGGGVEPDEIERLFDYARHRLWTAAWDDDEERGAAAGLAPDAALALVDRVIGGLYNRYALAVDPRFKQALRARNLPVETILFLERFKAALRKSPPDGPIPIHQVIYPRYWEKPTGAKKKKKKFGGKGYGLGGVPWEHQPVYGITLYEALAYTAWLTVQAEISVTLPDEAEYERAAGWPLEATSRDAGDLVLDPFRKAIFPWAEPGEPGICDFNSYFGQEGATLKEFFFYNEKQYQKLLENTARRSPDGRHIYQMAGFGWQWTGDRFDPTEHKYSRFDVHNYPVLRKPVCRLEAGGNPVPVFEYKPNSNMSHSYFVVRGAPDVIGGPGTVTRRFSMYPLRGYDNVGFRYVFRQG